jgi:hypothetical protein
MRLELPRREDDDKAAIGETSSETCIIRRAVHGRRCSRRFGSLCNQFRPRGHGGRKLSLSRLRTKSGRKLGKLPVAEMVKEWWGSFRDMPAFKLMDT